MNTITSHVKYDGSCLAPSNDLVRTRCTICDEDYLDYDGTVHPVCPICEKLEELEMDLDDAQCDLIEAMGVVGDISEKVNQLTAEIVALQAKRAFQI